jgi:hypothetical protein
MLNPVLHAEDVTGSPMFALQKGAPNLSLNPDASPAALRVRSAPVGWFVGRARPGPVLAHSSAWFLVR